MARDATVRGAQASNGGNSAASFAAKIAEVRQLPVARACYALCSETTEMSHDARNVSEPSIQAFCRACSEQHQLNPQAAGRA